jgi:hypothetical protein
MKQKQKFEDKVYRLKAKKAPMSYILPTRHSRAYPLTYFDESTGESKALRYATNQKTPFMEEQEGEVILKPVVFENGMLTVTKQNQILQNFLSFHPQNGSVFEEVNTEKDAQEELDILNIQADAIIEAKSLDVDALEMVYRVLFGRDPQRLTTAELKRDVLVYAKNNPLEFLESLSDPENEYMAQIQSFFDENLLSTRRSGSEVWFNTKGNKGKMLNVPHGMNKNVVVAEYLKSDQGIEALKHLEAEL